MSDDTQPKPEVKLTADDGFTPEQMVVMEQLTAIMSNAKLSAVGLCSTIIFANVSGEGCETVRKPMATVANTDRYGQVEMIAAMLYQLQHQFLHNARTRQELERHIEEVVGTIVASQAMGKPQGSA